MKKVGIFLISKNNYDFLEKYWVEHFTYEGFEVLNIDEGSSPEEQEKGKKICEANGITYLDREKPGLHNNVKLACEYFQSKGIDFLTWWQHDCWPTDAEFMLKLDDLVQRGKLEQFGTFGFNGFATDVSDNFSSGIKKIKAGKKVLGILGRSCTAKDRSWILGEKGKTKIPAIPDSPDFYKPFAVDSVAWFAIGLNIKKFIELVEPRGYGFHLAWDDICYQFLHKSIYNVALPDFYIEHRPDLKPDLGLPKNSAKYTRDKKNTYFFEQADQFDLWKNYWDWDWRERETFQKVTHRYANTLIYDSFYHDWSQGPYKTFPEVE